MGVSNGHMWANDFGFQIRQAWCETTLWHLGIMPIGIIGLDKYLTLKSHGALHA